MLNWELIRKGSCQYNEYIYIFLNRDTGQLEIEPSHYWDQTGNWIVAKKECLFEDPNAQRKMFCLQGNTGSLHDYFDTFADHLDSRLFPKACYEMVPDTIFCNRLSDAQKELLLETGSVNLNPNVKLELSYLTGNMRVILEHCPPMLVHEQDCENGPRIIHLPREKGLIPASINYCCSDALSNRYSHERGEFVDVSRQYDIDQALPMFPNQIKGYQLSLIDKAILAIHGHAIMKDDSILEFSAVFHTISHIRPHPMLENTWQKEIVSADVANWEQPTTQFQDRLYRFTVTPQSQQMDWETALADFPNQIDGLFLNSKAKKSIVFEDGFLSNNKIIEMDKPTGVIFIRSHDSLDDHPLGYHRTRLLLQAEVGQRMSLSKNEQNQSNVRINKNKDRGLEL